MFTPISSLFSGVAVGAGLMYFFDPDMGRRRRALCLDQCCHAINQLSKAADGRWKDMSNRTYGTFAQLRSSISEHDNSDTVVKDRVRSKLGRVVSHPSVIEVEAHNGEVTLSGPILSHEARKLVSAAKSVIGVNRVKNYLDMHDKPDISELQ